MNEFSLVSFLRLCAQYYTLQVNRCVLLSKVHTGERSRKCHAFWQGRHDMQTASNVSAGHNQKSWTLYKMYWRLANGTLRSGSQGVYDCGGSNEWFI